MQNNSGSFSLGLLSNRAAGNDFHGVYDSALGSALRIDPRRSDDSTTVGVNDFTISGGPSGGTCVGLICGNRSGASTVQAYKNGALLVNASVASTGRTTYKMALCANRRNSGAIFPNTEIVGYAAVGGSMTSTQALAEYNAWQQFLSDISGL